MVFPLLRNVHYSVNWDVIWGLRFLLNPSWIPLPSSHIFRLILLQVTQGASRVGDAFKFVADGTVDVAERVSRAQNRNAGSPRGSRVSVPLMRNMTLPHGVRVLPTRWNVTPNPFT